MDFMNKKTPSDWAEFFVGLGYEVGIRIQGQGGLRGCYSYLRFSTRTRS